MLEQLLALNIPEELIVVLIGTLPIFELRGAIPVGINVFHFPWYYAFLLALLGNLLPVPLILLGLEGVYKWLSRFPFFSRLFERLFASVRHRGGIVERYERIGLALFVAVPLPVTGAWTGAIAAVLFGISFRHAFLSITLGVIIAGVIVTTLSLLGWAGAVVAGVVLGGLAVYSLWRA